MYGLTMLKDCLNEFIDDLKTYDHCCCINNKRGTIALVDTKKSTIIGLVD